MVYTGYIACALGLCPLAFWEGLYGFVFVNLECLGMDEVLIGFIGVVITVVVSVVSTAYWLGSKFRGIEDSSTS